MEREFLVCPLCTDGCINGLQVEEDALVCNNCGGRYRIIEGIPALREVDREGSVDSQIKGELRYHEEIFVNMFLLRQYGHSVRVEKASHPVSVFSQFLKITGGAEVFYQTLLALAQPHLRRNSNVVDIGCGAGRLTGELARRVQDGFVIGIDYSSAMVAMARKVLFTNIHSAISFRVRTSKLKLVSAEMSGWGINNAALWIADAQRIPLRSSSVDMVACANLLHRVEDPRKVIQEIQRVLKNSGVLLASNSYDWREKDTPPRLWFDNLGDELDSGLWKMENEMDGIPFITPTYNRRYEFSLNHLQLFRKIK